MKSDRIRGPPCHRGREENTFHSRVKRKSTPAEDILTGLFADYTNLLRLSPPIHTYTVSINATQAAFTGIMSIKSAVKVRWVSYVSQRVTRGNNSPDATTSTSPLIHLIPVSQQHLTRIAAFCPPIMINHFASTANKVARATSTLDAG